MAGDKNRRLSQRSFHLLRPSPLPRCHGRSPCDDDAKLRERGRRSKRDVDGYLDACRPVQTRFTEARYRSLSAAPLRHATIAVFLQEHRWLRYGGGFLNTTIS